MAGHCKPLYQFYLFSILYSLLGSNTNLVRKKCCKIRCRDTASHYRASTTNSPYCIFSLALILMPYGTILFNLIAGHCKPLSQYNILSILYSLLGSNPNNVGKMFSNLMAGHCRPLNQFYLLSIVYILLGFNPNNVRKKCCKIRCRDTESHYRASTTYSPYCIFSLALVLMPHGTILFNYGAGQCEQSLLFRQGFTFILSNQRVANPDPVSQKVRFYSLPLSRSLANLELQAPCDCIDTYLTIEKL